MQNRFISQFIVPALVGFVAAGPVWATDYPVDTSAIARSTSGSDIATDIVNVTGDRDVTGDNAITIQGTTDTGGAGTAAGITINGGAKVTSTSGRSIQINDGGTVSATITNMGHIDNGITISGNTTIAGGVLSVTNGSGYASIHEGFIVNNNATASSSTSDTVSIGQNGYIDYINVETGSSLTNTGPHSAINVGADGQLGGSFNNTDIGGSEGNIVRNETDTILDIDGAVSSTGSSAINISTNGTATGKIDISGVVSGQQKTSSGGTEKGAINIDGTYTGSIEITGAVNDAIIVGGTHNATGDAIKTTSGGTLGDNPGEVILQVKSGASLSSSSSKAADLDGTIRGSIVNEGTITGGIEIKGNQSASGSAYESNNGSLTGGFTVSGTVSSSGNTISLTNGGTIDTVTVSSGSLTRTGGGNVIVLDGGTTKINKVSNSGNINGDITLTNNATIGNGPSQTGIENTGTITGNIVNGGLIEGINSTGTIVGGITNTGSITGGVTLGTVTASGANNSAYQSTGTGTLTGGMIINGNVSSDDNTISIGTGTSLDTLAVNSGGNLSTTDTTNQNAVKVDGTVTTISTSGTGTITGNINNEGTVTNVELTSQTSGGNVYSSAGGSLTNYTVQANGSVSSSGATAISLGQASGSNGTITNLTVNGTLKANPGGTAINLDATGNITNLGIGANGALGDSTDNGGTINNGGTIGTITNSGNIYGNINNAAAGNITTLNSTGTITGSITNANTIGTIAVKDQNAGSAAAYSSSGSATLTSYTVSGDVVTTGANAVSIGGTSSVGTITVSNDAGAKLKGGTNAINVVGSVTTGIVNNGTIEGNIANTGAVEAITNSGTFTGSIDNNSGTIKTFTNAATMTGNIDNDATIDDIVNTGTISGTINNNSTITNGINSTGIIDGSISNSGSIGSGVIVTTQTATGAAYLGNNSSTLTGTYDARGAVKSTSDHVVNLLSGSRVDQIKVSTGGSLIAEAASKHAIQLASGSRVDDNSVDEAETIISIESGAMVNATGTSGLALNVDTNVTGITSVGGTLSGAGGSIKINSNRTYTGSVEVENGGRISNVIDIYGTHTAAENTLYVKDGGTLGNGNDSQTVLNINADGALKTTSGSGAAIKNEGSITGVIHLQNNGSLQGAIHNKGSINGNILLEENVSSSESVYYSQGVSSSQKATMSGRFIVNNSKEVTSSADTLFLDSHSELSNITIHNGSKLKSTGTNKRAIYIAENAHLNSGAEGNEALTLSGDLTSDGGAAIEVQGALTGKLMINATGSITGKGGATDAAILLDGSGTHNGSIENRGVIRGGIYIDQNQTAANQAYLSQGLVSDRAALVGVNDQGGGYTIDDGVTVTSTGTDTLVVGGYSYVDSVVVSGTVSTVAGTAGSAGGNNAIRIASGGQLGGSDSSAGTGVNRLETDTVIDIEGTVSSVSGYAIQMDGVVTGVIRVDDGATLTGDTADGAIAINNVYTGAIRNLGAIMGDIDVSNLHQVTSGPLLYLTGNASVDGNYVVKNGGFAFSVSGTEILTEGTSNVTGVVVESGGTLGIDTSETIRARSGTTIDNVTVAGTLAGTVRSDGNIKAVSVELGGRHRANSDHALAIESGGTVESVAIKGTSYSTASQIGLLTSLASDKSAIYVANGGTLGTTEGTTAVTIDGQVTSTLGHAIDIAGTARGAMNIGQYGLVYAGEAADSSIKIGGSYTGRIYNQGEVASGITVDGTHTSSTQAYYAKGSSSSAKSKLAGGYRVMSGGSVSSNATHAVHLDEYSETDFIEVTGSGSAIKANADGQSAVYVADNAKLGNGITGIGITSGGLITGTGNVGSAAIKVDGTLSGNISVSNGGQLGNNTTAYAVDYANADTALNFVQNGASSYTRGRIQGSSQATDTVSIREGSFEGNLTGVEHLIISDDAYIKMHGDFTLPSKTTVYLDDNFNAGKSLITSTGTVYAHADRSNLVFVPEDNNAYLNLYRSGPVITVVDAQGVAGDAVNLIDVDSGSVLLQTETYVENNNIKVRLEASTSEDINGVMGQALLAALDPNADPVKSQQILTTLNQEEDVVGDIEDDVRADTTGYAHIAPREIALATQNIVFDRIDSLRAGGLNFGDDGYGFGLYGNSYDDEEEAREEEDDQQAYEPDEDAVSTSRYRQIRQMDYTLINGGTFWGQAMYLEGNHDKKNGSDGFNNRAGGIVLGVDSVVLDSFRMGVAATYGFGVVNTEGDRSTESHNFLGTVYGSWERGRYFVDTLLTLGTAQNETDKTVQNQKITGEYTSKQWNLKTVAGVRFAVSDTWEFTPVVEFNYGQVRFDAYEEKGNVGTEQKIEIQDYSALEMGLGFTLRGLFHNGTSYVEPDFTFKAYSDLNTTGSKVQYTFLAGGPSAYIEGPERDRQRYLTSFGLYFDMGSNWFVRTGYDYRWSQHYRSHAFNAKFRYHF
ncbi:hypothetical protein [Endozoicomonas numazuensis]|uniref:hypothetical protein n=1 Tax=Endozoicomonas numazuensis TaxID=1137799 RepID=UPI001F211991|nr:hypothetical protein [Endozoicomonas numazuensis]